MTSPSSLRSSPACDVRINMNFGSRRNSKCPLVSSIAFAQLVVLIDSVCARGCACVCACACLFCTKYVQGSLERGGGWNKPQSEVHSLGSILSSVTIGGGWSPLEGVEVEVEVVVVVEVGGAGWIFLTIPLLDKSPSLGTATAPYRSPPAPPDPDPSPLRPCSGMAFNRCVR